jgi:hypothetical protein
VSDPDGQAGQGGVGDGNGDEAGPADLGGGDPRLLEEPGGQAGGGRARVFVAEAKRQAGGVAAGRR